MDAEHNVEKDDVVQKKGKVDQEETTKGSNEVGVETAEGEGILKKADEMTQEEIAKKLKELKIEVDTELQKNEHKLEKTDSLSHMITGTKPKERLGKEKQPKKRMENQTNRRKIRLRRRI